MLDSDGEDLVDLKIMCQFFASRNLNGASKEEFDDKVEDLIKLFGKALD